MCIMSKVVIYSFNYDKKTFEQNPKVLSCVNKLSSYNGKLNQ